VLAHQLRGLKMVVQALMVEVEEVEEVVVVVEH
jgi:hypothetical protein